MFFQFKKVWFLILLCVALPFANSQAHLIGASYEEVVGDYLVDVGYNPEFILSDERMRFDFALYDKSEDEQWSRTPFTDVWVRITQDQKVFFAGGINNPNFGAPGFMYIFPAAGEYSVYVRYQNDGDRIVETSFPITVRENLIDTEDTNNLDIDIKTGIIVFILGIIFGVNLLVIIRKLLYREKK